jgi:ATP-dependent Lon protease
MSWATSNEEIALVRKIVEALENSPSIGTRHPARAPSTLRQRAAGFNDIADTLAAYLPITLRKSSRSWRATSTRAFNDMLGMIAEQKEISAIDEKLNDTVRERAEKSQKEYFLREKMKAIKDELGEGEDSEERRGLDQARNSRRTLTPTTSKPRSKASCIASR